MKKYFSMMLLAGVFVFFHPGTVRADEAEISSRMTKIEQNQEKILEALADIKNELQIVKVRVTSR